MTKSSPSPTARSCRMRRTRRCGIWYGHERRRRRTNCDTGIGCGVPLLETREKAHFMRVSEHEWQIARDQLAAGHDTEGRNR